MRLLALSLALASVLIANEANNPKAEGVKYIKLLGGTLKSNLKAKLKEDPSGIKAIEFCANRADEITKEVNSKLPKNAKVRRVSKHFRNPNNAPDSIDLKVLNEYEEKLKNKKFNPKDIAVVDVNGTVRVYKPLLVKNVCLKCHGSNVKPEIKEVISKKYPKDKAINLKLGTLRGAIVAEIKK